MIIQSTSSQWICKCAISCVNMITMIIKRGLDYRSDPWKTYDTYNSWKHTFMLLRNSCGNVFFVVCTKSSIWKIPADTVLLCFNIHQCVPRNNGAHLDPQCECISQLMDWIYQPHWWMVRDMFPFGLALLQKNICPLIHIAKVKNYCSIISAYYNLLICSCLGDVWSLRVKQGTPQTS